LNAPKTLLAAAALALAAASTALAGTFPDKTQTLRLVVLAGVNYLGRPATTILAGRMRGGWHLRRGRGVFGLGLL
jgi:hypothetical protein